MELGYIAWKCGCRRPSCDSNCSMQAQQCNDSKLCNQNKLCESEPSSSLSQLSFTNELSAPLFPQDRPKPFLRRPAYQQPNTVRLLHLQEPHDCPLLPLLPLLPLSPRPPPPHPLPPIAEHLLAEAAQGDKFEEECPEKPNLAQHLGVNYRIVLTHYASMKKEVLFVPFVRGTRDQYLLLNLQNYLDFDVEELIQVRNQERPLKVGQVFAVKPSGRLSYEALYFCKLPFRIRNFEYWKKIGSLIVRRLLTNMDELDHKKIIFPHFRIYGLPEEFQIKGFLMGFMNAKKKLHYRRMEHPLLEVMLTTSNKVHYEIWKEWLKDVAKLLASGLHDDAWPDHYQAIIS